MKSGRGARSASRPGDRGRLLLKLARLWLCYDWESLGSSARRWRIPPRVRAYLRRACDIGPAAAEALFSLAEQGHKTAIENGTFQAGRIARQAAAGRRSGAVRRAAVADRDREIVRCLDDGQSARAVADALGVSRPTVAGARERLMQSARRRPAAAPDTAAAAPAPDTAAAAPAPDTAAAAPAPDTAAAADTCDDCNGTGELRFLGDVRPCRRCAGTGRAGVAAEAAGEQRYKGSAA